MNTEQDVQFHRAFVGREPELSQLTEWFDRTASGHGGLVMVVGEPGIGKTTLTEQLAEHVAEQGGQTLVGHCYEEGSLSLPYLPFVEALRTHVLATDAEELRAELGPDVVYVARIVPEVRDRLNVEIPASTDPDEDRYRLLQGTTDFLQTIGSRSPLLLVLEDLHDADKGTLDLLLHASRRLDDMPVLIVGTYRDVEVDRSHPLSSSLAELRRSSSFDRLSLRGLTPDEVQRMIKAMSGHEVRWSLVEAVHRQTEGNPLFVQEVLRYFVEQGFVTRQGERWRDGGELPEASIPEGLRDVIGKRLSGLSSESNSVLSVAAVIGRDFSLDILARVVEATDEAVVTALDEARSAGIVEERTSPGGIVNYRFSHAFFRQTLYEETGAARRLRLHQLVGRAIEEVHARRLDQHAAELAEHFSHSTSEDDLTKAVSYGEHSAAQAMSVYGYGEAIHLLEKAIDVQDVLDPSDKGKRFELLLSLGGALIPGGDPRRAFQEVAEQAFTIAAASGDDLQAMRACHLALTAMQSVMYGQAPNDPRFRTWVERGESFAKDGTGDQARIDIFKAILLWADGKLSYSIKLKKRALQTARGTRSIESLLGTASANLALPTSPSDEGSQLSLAEELADTPREGASVYRQNQILSKTANKLRSWGKRDRSAALLAMLKLLSEQTRDPNVALNVAQLEGIGECIDGRFDWALDACSKLIRITEEAGIEATGRSLGWTFIPLALLRVGRTEEAVEWVSRGPMMASVVDPLIRAWCFAHAGRADEARAAMNQVLSVSGFEPDHPMAATPVLAMLLETALLLGDLELVGNAAAMLEPVASMFPLGSLSCVGRNLGAAAHLLGDAFGARTHYEQALLTCEAAGARAELALTKLGLAELLVEHFPDERDLADSFLASAIDELRDMKMQPALERALALQERFAGTSAKASRNPDGLTDREVEVLKLVAAGRTDQEIADTLTTVRRTASNHVANIFRKVNASNRAEAAAYAVRQGLR